MRQFNLGHREPFCGKWPMSQQTFNTLSETMLVSPRVGNDHGYAPPTDAVYDYEVNQLPQLRQEVEKNIWPGWFFEEHLGRGSLSPVLKKHLNLSESNVGKCADTVKMDHPFDIWDLVLEKFQMELGLPVPANHLGNPFVESVLLRGDVHQRIAFALNKSFDVKYFFGQCRPIEYFSPDLQRFSTPTHPECPAGHGAFCGAGYKAFEDFFGNNEEAEFATKQFAMFRSLSGMHIPYSNMLGWQVGYEA